MGKEKDIKFHKFSTEPIFLLITSEPKVIFTRYGYAPVVEAKVIDTENEELGLLNLSPASLARQIYKLVENNDNKFLNLEIYIQKESEDKQSPYVVKEP